MKIFDRFKKNKEDNERTISYADSYLVRYITLVYRPKTMNTLDLDLYLMSDYKIIYEDENLKEIDVETKKELNKYPKEVKSLRDVKYEDKLNDDKYYIYKKSLLSMGIDKNLEQAIMVSHKDLRKLLKRYNKKNDKNKDIFLSTNTKEVEKQLLEEGINDES